MFQAARAAPNQGAIWRPRMDSTEEARAARAAKADAAFVEAARGAPAAFYQFRLSPKGEYSMPFVSPDFAARFEIEVGDPEETAARFMARIHPDDLSPLLETIGKSAASLTKFESSFRFRLTSGAEVWASAASNPVRTEDGGILWNGIAGDITARETAARDLRESEERFRAIFESSRDAVFLSDERGAFVEVNGAAAALTGFSRVELLAMGIPDLHEEADLGAYRTFHRRILRGEAILSVAPIRRKDGRKVAVEFSNSLVVIGGKHLVHTAGRDMTERAQFTQRVATHAAIGRVLAEEATLSSAVPRILQALGEGEGMAFGAWWEPDVDTGNLRSTFTWSADLARCAELAAETRLRAVESGKAIPGEVWQSRRALHIPDLVAWNGCPRVPAAVHAGLRAAVGFPLLRDGAAVGVVEFFAREIPALDPELAATVEMLGGQLALYLEHRRAHEEAFHFLAASPAVLYALRIVGTVLKLSWFSDNIEALTGYSRAEVETEEQAWWLSGIHPEDLPRVLDANAIVLGKGVASVEFRFRRKDATWFWVRDEKRLLRGPDGAPTEIVGSWLDVTARVSLEEQLRQAQKMEAFGQLAGGVAHDFNNLLTVISGNTDLLLADSPADDPKRAALTDIRAAGERAANLTRQLLAFSRKQILEPRLVDVHGVIRGIEKMLRRLIGEDVDILTDLAADPSFVTVDPGQLEQVVMNLAVNARDAMPRGGRITIRTRNVGPGEAQDSDETGGRRQRPRVAISVSDTGTGIPPEAKDHLFEPFFTTKEVGKGTGLGLATVYGIVKQSGGDVTVESESGKGATFTVVLPSQPAPLRRGVSGISPGAVPRGTETVLVVEDEDAVRRIVQVALESAGYRVVQARNGPEALDAARKHAGTIDLVVTDVVMPGMSGRELAEKILKERPAVRLLFMSGYTDDATVRHGIVESRVAFLQKPFSPRALARKVREVLDSNGS